jgi:hypothetical protein
MELIPGEKIRRRNLYRYVGFSCIVWGIIVLPALMFYFWEFSISIMSCFIGLIMAFIFTVVPISMGKNWPQKDKEYQVIFYPLITLPISILAYAVKYVW